MIVTDSIKVNTKLIKELERTILNIPMGDNLLRCFEFILDYKGIFIPSSRPKKTYIERKEEFKQICLEGGVLPFTELPLEIVETGYKNSYNEDHNHKIKLLPVNGLEESLINGTTIPDVPNLKIHSITYKGRINDRLNDSKNIFNIINDYISDKLCQGYELTSFTSKNSFHSYLEFSFYKMLNEKPRICLSYEEYMKDMSKSIAPELFDWFENLKEKYGVNNGD